MSVCTRRPISLQSDIVSFIPSLRRALATLTGEGDLGSVLRAAGWVLAIRVVASGLGYAAIIALARWMGATEFGIYTYAWASVSLLALVAGLGLHSVCVRYVPQYVVTGDHSRLRGILARSVTLVLISSSVGAVVAVAVLSLLRDRLGPQYIGPLLFAFAGLPVMTLATLMSQVGRALGSVVLGYAPSQIGFPALVIATAAALRGTSGRVTAVALVPLSLLLYLVTVLAQMAAYLGRLRPRLRGVVPIYETVAWLRTGLSLVLFDGFSGLIVHTDLLVLGAVCAPRDVAHYNAAVRTAMLVQFLGDAVGSLAGPKIAAMHARGKGAELQSLLRGMLSWLLLPSAAVTGALVVLGPFVLRLFGPGFESGYPPLVILALSNFLTVCVGPVALTLNMTGHQNDCAKALGVTAAANAALNLALVPPFGLIGAALATATSLLLSRVWLFRLAVRRLELDPSALSLVRGRPSVGR